MGNNIELFDKYILEELTSEEIKDFESRLKTDSVFAQDFRIYLFTVKGIQAESSQDNLEIGHAIKQLTPSQLNDIMGRKSRPKMLRRPYLRERLAWASSVAALLIVGFFSIFFVERSNRYQYDNLIVEYNYIYASRGSEGLQFGLAPSEKQIKEILPELWNEYQSSSNDDLQSAEARGMWIAMEYLKLHDRKKTIEVLEYMSSRFAEDEEFAAQCERIINQLR